MDIENGGADHAHAEQNDTKMASPVEIGIQPEERTQAPSADGGPGPLSLKLEERSSSAKSDSADVVNGNYPGDHGTSSTPAVDSTAAAQHRVDSNDPEDMSQLEGRIDHGPEPASSIPKDQSLLDTSLNDSNPPAKAVALTSFAIGDAIRAGKDVEETDPAKLATQTGDEIKVLKHVSGHLYLGTNLRTQVDGQFVPEDVEESDPAPPVLPHEDRQIESSETNLPDMSVTHETRDESSGSGKSDSEAETVLLPGVDGYSPSKVRKTIKLEDKANDLGDIARVEEKDDYDRGNAEANREGSNSHLGKRKRLRNGNGLDRQHAGYSSGLSSVPTSPVATLRSTLRKSGTPELEPPSPEATTTATAKATSSEGRISPQQAGFDRNSGGDKGAHDARGAPYTGDSNSDEQAKAPKVARAASHTEESKRHNNKRSTSPNPEYHKRSVSNQLSASSSLSSSHRKKRPGPLRTTRDRQSNENISDEDSSVGESSHPRRSRTRNLATPPTGESISSSKMPKRRRLLYGSSALAVACEHGEVEKARQELREAPEDLNSADNAGNTPLQCASINGHADVVRFLIDEGCDIHCVNNRKDSPLLDAVENSHLEVVKILLAAGVNPRARNLEGEEPINKIDEDNEAADAIREALIAARPRAVAPDTASHTPSAATQKSNMNNIHPMNPRTLSHGRSRRTGENQLFLQLNVSSLRQAASTGDQETALRIVDAIGVNGLDDPESLVNAARGGHEDVLQLLMALGDANPDPRPLPHKDPEYATPILAAIGGDNIGVIKLLLGKIEDGKFDPRRKYNGRTYYEIARERAGPHWQEEERILKEEYEKYDPSLHHGESNSYGNSRSSSKRQPEGRSSGSRKSLSSVTSHTTKRDHRGSTSTAEEAMTKRGPGRPRKDEKKDGRERSDMSDHDIPQKKSAPKRSGSDTPTVPSESEPGKDQRKRQRLFSAKDLKRRMERRESVASVMSADENATNPLAESGSRSKTAHGDTAPKRRRSSLTPPAQGREKKLHGSEHPNANKRRRLEPGQRHKDVASPRSSSSPDSNMNAQSADAKPASSKGDGHLNKGAQLAIDHVDSRSHSNLQKADISLSGNSIQPSRSTPSVADKVDVAAADSIIARDAAEKEVRIKREVGEKLERQERQKQEEARIAKENQARLAKEEEARLAEEEAVRLAKEEEARLVKEEAARLAKEEARLAKEEEERRQQMEIEKAKALQRQQEKLARREAEEEERREQRRREEAEAHAKAEEERRRLYNEQQRIQREEQERRRAAHIAQQRAERQRILQEEKEARLAKLPPLLRWFDGVENPLTPEFAYMFRGLQGVRYDTIRPEATGSAEGKEQWLLNVQVALLLGEKELEFPRYTHWTHIEVSYLAKRTLWKVLSEDYACISEHLRRPVGLPTEPDVNLSSKMRNEAWPLFQAYPMFFVKLSDFMSIVPRYPHLRNIEILIKYRELPPDETWLSKVTFPAKWKQDDDAGTRYGFAPGTKFYLNGQYVRENKPRFARTSSTPFPSHRVPRIGGIHEVFPGDPSYERLCKEQGLEHLLIENAAALTQLPNGITVGNTPPESNSTNEDDLRRLSAASAVSVSTADKIVTNGTPAIGPTEPFN